MMNQYNSIYETMNGSDAYNLVMPVLPPANLSLTTTLFTPRFLAPRDSSTDPVVKFNITDNPYLKSFGLFSNLADGLVNGATSEGLRVLISLRRYGTVFAAGTISMSKDSKVVTGVATAFVNDGTWQNCELVVIDDFGAFQTYTIKSVSGATTLTLTTPALSNVTGKVFACRGQSLTGTIANVAGAAAVVGTNTQFVKELAPGMQIMWLDDSLNVREGTVSAIADATHLTLTAASSNVAASMFAAVNTSAARAYPLVQSGGSISAQVQTLNTLYAQSFQIGDVSFAKPIRGLVSFAAAVAGGADTAATGIGTKFTEDVVIGQGISYVSDAGVPVTVLVGNVVSDTQLTITTPAAGVAGVATVGTRLSLFWLDAFLAVRVQLLQTLSFYTITVDPAFTSPRRLSFSYCGEVEHNKVLFAGLL